MEDFPVVGKDSPGPACEMGLPSDRIWMMVNIEAIGDVSFSITILSLI